MVTHALAAELSKSDIMGGGESNTWPICRIIFSVIREMRVMRSSFSAKEMMPVRSTPRRDGPGLRPRPIFGGSNSREGILSLGSVVKVRNPGHWSRLDEGRFARDCSAGREGHVMGMAHLKRDRFRRDIVADWTDESMPFPTLVGFRFRA